ncbi:hypothetical protein [Yoonia sp.]|uniref:hypothetical protein n=1 Tax=Yoonia sp. TaxID=2212373 RepID=UPI0025D9C558|nr:hypothetical protein [Yoonia sp.]
MTTNFALSLSLDGIQLLHRVRGGWRLIGKADLDDADLDATLAQMRANALAIEPGGLRTKIVIPLDQVKYIAIDSTRTDMGDIHRALHGATPYALDELVIDCERFGGRTHIAAVARETLDEAEAFARAHRFSPVCFVAVPAPFTFQSEVFFGPTAMMPEVLGADGRVTRDALPVLVVGTRIKSRLLVFETDEQDMASSGGFDLDALLAPVAAPRVARPTPPAAAVIWIDRVVPEYHAPPVIDAAPVVRAATAAMDAMRMDAVIPEYHAQVAKLAAPRPSAVAPTLNTAPPLAAIAKATTPRRAPTAAVRRNTPWVWGAGLAASVALAGFVVWSQTNDAVPVAVAPAIPAAETQDKGPDGPLLDIAGLPPIDANDGPVTWPERVAAGAIVTTPPPAVILATAPDAVPPPVQGPPEPTLPETVQATVGAPVLRGRVLSPAEAEQIYAATGVWQRAPRFVDVPRTTKADGIMRPDPATVPGRIRQPATLDQTAAQPATSFLVPADPPPADVSFVIDDDGFILATSAGALTPEGAVVFAGLPDFQVRLRPELSEADLARMAALAPAPDGVVVIAGQPAVQPVLRPTDTTRPPPVATAGGVALAGLQPRSTSEPEATAAVTDIRPRLRPTAIFAAARPSDFPSNPDITAVIAGIASDTQAAPFIDITPNAIGASRRPETRPKNFARVVASALARAPAATATTATPRAPQQAQPTPEITLPPSTGAGPGGVARAATEEGVLRLRDINLIGVYGRSNDRRALVRLGNGRYVRVEVGSALDGGQVTAIGEGVLNYVKRGRTYALELPAG